MRKLPLGWLAASLNLAVVLIAVAISLVRGSLDPAWTVVQWYPAPFSEVSIPLVLIGLLLVGLANSWMFWQVLKGPAERLPLSPRARGLRWLLYVYVVWRLLPLPLAEGPATAVDAALWVSIVVLFAGVVTGSERGFRLAMIAFSLLAAGGGLLIETGVLVRVAQATPMLVLAVALALGAAALTGLIMMLIAQRRDGRWSRATLVLGALQFLSFLPSVVGGLFGEPVRGLLEVVALFEVVWLARTAHELSAPTTGSEPAPLRPPAWLLVPALLLIAPEALPHDTATWRDADCSSIPRYADASPQERRRAYLCLAANEGYGFLRDEAVTDRHLLSEGWKRCAAGEIRKGRAEILVYLCPDAVAREHPDLLLSSAQLRERQTAEQAERRTALAAEAAEYAGSCRDPWPTLRAVHEVTAAHLPTDWDGYRVYDGRAASLDALQAEQLDYDRPLVAAGGAAVVTTTIEYGGICVTVKLVNTPPSLRRRGWDAVAEADLRLTTGRLHLRGRGLKVALPLPKAGRYRVRLHTRTLDEGVGEDLIVVYPEPRDRSRTRELSAPRR
ncbi:hypothetical protein ACIBG7_30375 [Nonomuraea sp. NPDC050328]|uniref:hypothetical protein n=1 Tax=Nonomuraea sp. NPDC050328 TaxID=3364361 RepID=UPI00379DC69D